MPKPAKPRKAYRPAPVHANAFALAIARAHKLQKADVERQLGIMQTALAEFSKGQRCPVHWLSLADTANVAEQLAAIAICSGPDATQVISAAQRVLHDVMVRQRGAGSWTLHAAELEALRWLVRLHGLQLRECSHSEFQRAYDAAHRKVAQARAGNAPAGAIVIEGEIA